MRNSIIGFLFIISVLTTGCAIHRLKNGMNEQMGEPIDRLIDILGYPMEEKVIAERKIYFWQISSTHYSPNIQTTSYSGMIGAKPIYGTATTYGGVTSMPVSCKLSVEVDSDDRIISWRGEGSEFGCRPYANRFE